MKFKSVCMALAMIASVNAGAATINLTTTSVDGYTKFSFDNTSLFGTGVDASVICPDAACAFLGAQDLKNAGDSTELGYLESLLGTTFDNTTLIKDDNPGNTFDVTEKYFMVKFGSSISVWFQNLWFPGDAAISVKTGKGAGLSHVSTFDFPYTTTEVPLPGTMSLLGLGLAGLGLIRKNKNA